jgi:glyoxylase-like metal-dependent hydrolase (beta-lactamase superfamily II)
MAMSVVAAGVGGAIGIGVGVGGIGVVGLAASGCSVDATPPPSMSWPGASPPASMRVEVLDTGDASSLAAFAYEGGGFHDERRFATVGVLVRHPRGDLLFDAGWGAAANDHRRDNVPSLMRAATEMRLTKPMGQRLAEAGLDAHSLAGVILTHAHWDHASGLADLPGATVWLNDAERAFVDSGNPSSALLRQLLPSLHVRRYTFERKPYLGFNESLDVYGDGSIVLVPASGHTPGSILAFVALPSGAHLLLVGDLAWQREGIELVAPRPRGVRRLVDVDADAVEKLLQRVHTLSLALPGLVVVPAHDRRVLDALPNR